MGVFTGPLLTDVHRFAVGRSIDPVGLWQLSGSTQHRSKTMLREVVNAVVLTFVVSEWLSEKPGRRLVLFARRDASTKALCAALGCALLLVNFVGDHVPALGGLLASNVVAAIVEGAVLAAGAYGTAKITRRPCLCGVPTFKKGDVDKSAFLRAFLVCTILCYVQGGMSFAHVYVRERHTALDVAQYRTNEERSQEGAFVDVALLESWYAAKTWPPCDFCRAVGPRREDGALHNGCDNIGREEAAQRRHVIAHEVHEE